MTSQERQDTLESLKLSSIVAVTLLYEDGSVLCSTFSSAADFSKVVFFILQCNADSSDSMGVYNVSPA